MKLVYLGTPDMAVPPLRALHGAGHQIALVVSGVDKRRGRRGAPSPSPVKAAALELGLEVSDDPDDLLEVGADLGVVVAYGRLLRPHLVSALDMVNLHFSLLPRWRGAAPIQRAILAGDPETGVTIMQMDAGLDTGGMILKQAIPIAENDNAQTLHDKLAALGAQLIVRALHEQPAVVAQDPAQASYAAKITKAEARIDWTRPAAELARAIRAYNPMPGAYTGWQGQPLKLWRAEAVSAASAVPGTVLQADAQGIVVATGEGALRLHELQRAGSKRLAAQAFLAGATLHPGDHLDA